MTLSTERRRAAGAPTPAERATPISLSVNCGLLVLVVVLSAVNVRIVARPSQVGSESLKLALMATWIPSAGIHVGAAGATFADCQCPAEASAVKVKVVRHPLADREGPLVRS